MRIALAQLNTTTNGQKVFDREVRVVRMNAHRLFFPDRRPESYKEWVK